MNECMVHSLDVTENKLSKSDPMSIISICWVEEMELAVEAPSEFNCFCILPANVHTIYQQLKTITHVHTLNNVLKNYIDLYGFACPLKVKIHN